MRDNVFKDCPVCQASWRTRDEFITDAKITLTGYQVNFDTLEKGLFLFEHVCGATLTLGVHAFTDLYAGPIERDRKTGSESCPGYCLYVDSLRPCPERCECAYVRDILELLQ